MKKFTWQQWTSMAIVLAVIIVEVVLCFVQPFAAIWGAAGFIVGNFTGYLLFKNHIVNTTEE